MKIPLKTPQEIEIMKVGGHKLANILTRLLESAKPGVSLKNLDQLADSLIAKENGRPSFKMVRNYHWATCLNVNQGVVHGIPNDYCLKNGDLLSVDVGIFYQGFHTDAACTIEMQGKKKKAKKNFLQIGEKALKEAIAVACPGNRIGNISKAIEKKIRSGGFFPIEQLSGHGVGQKLHELPTIPCFLKEEVKKTPEIKPGMVLAIEVIYAQNGFEIVITHDGWTVETADGCSAALFEKTIAVTKANPIILTDWKS